jgi:oxygen-independent coproporphyrinogen-3 oxidase
MEDQALALLEAAGLKRYEVSNFARPGRACRHNQDTWRGGDYLALGPGAHGHLSGVRWAYLPDVEAYLAGVAAGEEPLAWREELSDRQRALELIMLGLRTVEGVDLAAAARLWPGARGPEWGQAREALVRRGWANQVGSRLRPTPLGLRLADAAAGLFA